MEHSPRITRAAVVWKACHAAVPGLKHRRAAQPGQDACLATADGEYPFLVVCDGRGSASHADLGAEGAVTSIAMQMENCRDLLAVCLDGEREGEASVAFGLVTRLLCRTAAQTQRRLATHYRQPPEVFEHTFLVACIGQQRLGWLQVGDGGLVIQRRGNTENIGTQEHHECANLTHFVSVAEPFAGLQIGLLPAGDISAIAGFTDGTAGRMLRSTDSLPAPAFAGLWDLLRQGQQTPGDLAGFLRRPDWEPTVTDDRSLALLVRQDVAEHCARPTVPGAASALPAATVRTARRQASPSATVMPSLGVGDSSDTLAGTGTPGGVTTADDGDGDCSVAPSPLPLVRTAPLAAVLPRQRRRPRLCAGAIILAGLLHAAADVWTGNDPHHPLLYHAAITVALLAASASMLHRCLHRHAGRCWPDGVPPRSSP